MDYPLRPAFYSISRFGGISNSFGVVEPFLLRWRTHSLKRYSIWPFTDRKSSSAHCAIAAYSLGESLSGICFFALSAAMSIQAAAVYNGLRIAVAAKHNKQV